MSQPHSKKSIILREQVDLVRLMDELKNSISVAKDQINTLTVETLHLKYLQIVNSKKDPMPGSAVVSSQTSRLDLSIKTEKKPDDSQEEEDEEN